MSNELRGSTNMTENGSNYSVSFCLDFTNKRLRVEDYRYQGTMDCLYERVTQLAAHHGLTKVFFKAREEDWRILLAKGCMLEGIYKGYFRGQDAFCMAVYFDLVRRNSDYWLEEDQLMRQVLALPRKPERPEVPEGLLLRMAGSSDAESLSELYRQTFQTYPTPMNDSAYVAHTMEEGTIYYLVEVIEASEPKKHLISAASAEMNATYANAEMTDCATLPTYRNRGLMRLLLHALEDELLSRGITCAYSLSRALSFGMNAAFYQMNYDYYGRLTKNCDIYDKFEDMNLWAKDLRHP
ncbi:putative beta-lysine N-acetyltransferase [Paenibacillus roseipurpureus]|uniref:Beta-lysine N-acetyltransferase n=1 Tax=Paenibacillus roseopurpureus TaxID=2918901 RepID=A0AA96LQJ9_9BACL|nr:putative beta-lysine N-acetyltransferase [Paenibacillus sp. MBLB1832]WNR45477.1 putative beta-lysine N-acetyltransferase [Paenibacillus sp. MBLB1832]